MPSKLTTTLIVSCILLILLSVDAFSPFFSSDNVSAIKPVTLSESHSQHSSPHIILSTNNHSDTPLYKRANKIMSVALQKLGYKLTIKTLPNQRSLLWANNGMTDGDLFRVSKLDLKKLPNLEQVIEPLFTIDQSVLSKKNIKVDGWSSMKNYTIAYERGTSFIKRKEENFKQVYLVNRTEQAISMVFNDRADLTITSFDTATKFLRKNKEHAKKIKILQPPLVSITLHVYLNKQRHKQLARELSVVLKEMKRTGEFQQLLNSTQSKSIKMINPTEQ